MKEEKKRKGLVWCGDDDVAVMEEEEAAIYLAKSAKSQGAPAKPKKIN